MSQVYDKDYPMPVICAWCKEKIGDSFATKPGQVSHGICDDCAEIERHEQRMRKLWEEGDILDEV